MPNENVEAMSRQYVVACVKRINIIALRCLCSDRCIDDVRETDQLVYCAGSLVSAFEESFDGCAIQSQVVRVEQMASALIEARGYIVETMS